MTYVNVGDKQHNHSSGFIVYFVTKKIKNKISTKSMYIVK